jgi:fatty-acyl-CoA synthase
VTEHASTLIELLQRRAVEGADRVAYVHREERVTWGELWRDAETLARGLHRAGAQTGERVALLLPAGLDLIRLFWAIQRTGAAAVIFNPTVPPQTAAARAVRVRPRLVVTSPHTLDCDGPLPPLSTSSEDLAFLQPTSGTSGEPRAVMIRHRNVLAVLRASAAINLTRDDVLVSWVPPWHDLGLVRFVAGTAFVGARCHTVEPAVRTIPEWLATISSQRATITGAPDFAYRLASRLVDPRTVDITSLRYATNGAEPVRLDTITTFEERFGLRDVVAPGYGLAEATLGVTTVRPGEPVRTDARGNVSCGRPFDGVTVRLENGEILVRSEGVFAGYFDAEEETARVLRDGWLHTGDTGSLDADGHLYVLGRTKSMLKRGGSVLAPRELEEVAQRVRGVNVAAAVGIARNGTEEIVVAIEAEGDSAAIAANVAESLREAMGFVPERVVVVERRGIPRTHNGKVRHDLLRTSLRDGAVAIVHDTSESVR